MFMKLQIKNLRLNTKKNWHFKRQNLFMKLTPGQIKHSLNASTRQLKHVNLDQKENL